MPTKFKMNLAKNKDLFAFVAPSSQLFFQKSLFSKSIVKARKYLHQEPKEIACPNP
jgi:hypothetical protein